MKKRMKTIVLGVLALMGLMGVLWSHFSPSPPEATVLEGHVPDQVPIKGMVTMLDLGANSCIPCKMMAPIMEKVKKRYEGKAAIIFIDVWKDKQPATRFGISAIPTQIFFDKQGKEIYRHVGFLSEEAIVAQLKKMGVD